MHCSRLTSLCSAFNKPTFALLAVVDELTGFSGKVPPAETSSGTPSDAPLFSTSDQGAGSSPASPSPEGAGQQPLCVRGASHDGGCSSTVREREEAAAPLHSSLPSGGNTTPKASALSVGEWQASDSSLVAVKRGAASASVSASASASATPSDSDSDPAGTGSGSGSGAGGGRPRLPSGGEDWAGSAEFLEVQNGALDRVWCMFNDGAPVGEDSSISSAGDNTRQ